MVAVIRELSAWDSFSFRILLLCWSENQGDANFIIWSDSSHEEFQPTKKSPGETNNSQEDSSNLTEKTSPAKAKTNLLNAFWCWGRMKISHWKLKLHFLSIPHCHLPIRFLAESSISVQPNLFFNKVFLLMFLRLPSNKNCIWKLENLYDLK